MRYAAIEKAIFLKRPNRFIANVLLGKEEQIVHVKNTGRCREILLEGTTVFLESSANPQRKTRYSLISAYKGTTLINIDSQIPNSVVAEAIRNNQIPEFSNCSMVKREVTFGNSRFDLYYENQFEKGFIEVKGVTLEDHGIALFPDAPTERGTKHILEMIKAVEAGYMGTIFFLIQLKDVNYFKPNTKMDPNFSAALSLAKEKGVRILVYDAVVTSHEITLGHRVAFRLS